MVKRNKRTKRKVYSPTPTTRAGREKHTVHTEKTKFILGEEQEVLSLSLLEVTRLSMMLLGPVANRRLRSPVEAQLQLDS